MKIGYFVYGTAIYIGLSKGNLRETLVKSGPKSPATQRNHHAVNIVACHGGITAFGR
jgi:hypothetical protein